MATTTPNYGWDVPTSTDSVKDGASAIETLGDDIDATLFSVSGGKNVAMVYLNTYTWSGTNTLAIDNLFTTTYDDYKIFIQFSAASAYSGIFWHPRISGTDQTTNQRGSFVYISGTSVLNAGAANLRLGDVVNTGAAGNQVDLTIHNPMNTSYWTTFTSDSTYTDTTTPSSNRISCAGSWQVTTAADGIKFYLSGAVTGTAKVLVYGIRKV
jgi:hypothetical protein